MVECIRYLCDHSTDPTGVIARQILGNINRTKDEVLWLRHDSKGFRMHAFSDSSYNPSYYGSACAIRLSSENKYKTRRNRHMQPKMKALKKWIVQGSLKTGEVHTNKHHADMLINVVVGKKLKKFNVVVATRCG